MTDQQILEIRGRIIGKYFNYKGIGYPMVVCEDFAHSAFEKWSANQGVKSLSIKSQYDYLFKEAENSRKRWKRYQLKFVDAEDYEFCETDFCIERKDSTSALGELLDEGESRFLHNAIDQNWGEISHDERRKYRDSVFTKIKSVFGIEMTFLWQRKQEPRSLSDLRTHVKNSSSFGRFHRERTGRFLEAAMIRPVQFEGYFRDFAWLRMISWRFCGPYAAFASFTKLCSLLRL